MVTTIKILKRKDASSVVVAVVIALILSPMLSALTIRLTDVLSGGGNLGPGLGWQAQYLHPIFSAALQMILLEIVLWLYANIAPSLKK